MQFVKEIVAVEGAGIEVALDLGIPLGFDLQAADAVLCIGEGSGFQVDPGDEGAPAKVRAWIWEEMIERLGVIHDASRYEETCALLRATFAAPAWEVVRGDCLDVLSRVPDNFVDSVVTDPPAGMAFMSKEWDDFRRKRNGADAGRDSLHGRLSRSSPQIGRSDREAFVEFLGARLRECYRVLKPGGYALVWAHVKTSGWTHRACEDAGFEVVDRITHLYGTGTPKGYDASKLIDQALGVERPNEGENLNHRPVVQRGGCGWKHGESGNDAPGCAQSARWEGWSWSLSPGQQDWIVAQKPRSGTIAENLLEHGVGAFHIDACRTERGELSGYPKNVVLSHLAGCRRSSEQQTFRQGYILRPGSSRTDQVYGEFREKRRPYGKPGQVEHASVWECLPECPVAEIERQSAVGRWPKNVVLSHTPMCVALDNYLSVPVAHTTDSVRSRSGDEVLKIKTHRQPWGERHAVEPIQRWECAPNCPIGQIDRQSGQTQSRKGKPRRAKERGTVLAKTATGTEYEDFGGASRFFYCANPSKREKTLGLDGRNPHPTVKPMRLMRWLCRLVTPPGGLVVDPFCGTGTTGMACVIEGFRFLGVEKDPENEGYVKVARARIAAAEGLT